MGADIHMWIETRLSKEYQWTVEQFHDVQADADDPDIVQIEPEFGQRNYRMFAVLANVRGNAAIYRPRDLPRDISTALAKKADQDGSDGHSHSWLTMQEFKECIDASEEGTYVKDYEDVYNLGIQWLVNETAEQQLLSTGWEPQARVVFWFDN